MIYSEGKARPFVYMHINSIVTLVFFGALIFAGQFWLTDKSSKADRLFWAANAGTAALYVMLFSTWCIGASRFF